MRALSPTLVLRTAAQVGSARLVEAWNRAYAGYPVDVHHDAAGLAAHVEAHSVDLERSLVVTDAGDEPAGIALLGVRPGADGEPGERGWVGGFGLAPAHRGLGLAAPLARALLDLARDRGVRDVRLEVLTGNDAARRTYERVGFAVTRRLLVLDGSLTFHEPRDVHEPHAPHDPPAGAADPGPGVVAALTEADVAALERLSTAVRQPWGREPGALRPRAGDVVARCGPQDGPRAVVLARETAVGHLIVLGAAATDLAGARVAVAALARTYPGVRCRVVNEPQASPLVTAFGESGLAEVLAQHEMLVDLSRPSAST